MAINTSKKGSSATNEASFSSANSNVILVPKPLRHTDEAIEESIIDAPEEIQK
jgi:hypothetical protein